MDNQLSPYGMTRDNGDAYWSMSILWIMLATYETTAGEYSLIEELLPHGLAAPPHIHEQADEAFYIVEGEATFMVNDQTIHASAGSYLTIPRQTKHAFQIDSETSRLLNWYYPAGFEHAIIAGATPARERTLPPLSTETHQTQERITQEVVKKYPAAATTYVL